MIRASIPGYRTAEGGPSTGRGRIHHVYTVHVTTNGRLHKIHKRYSAFHKLHHLFRKDYIIECEFPPKRLRNSTSKVLEYRRLGLEQWLQEVLTINPPPPQLLDFLQVAQDKQHNTRQELCQQSVFTSDPFLLPCAGNIVQTAVLAALYDNALKLPQ